MQTLACGQMLIAIGNACATSLPSRRRMYKLAPSSAEAADDAEAAVCVTAAGIAGTAPVAVHIIAGATVAGATVA